MVKESMAAKMQVYHQQAWITMTATTLQPSLTSMACKGNITGFLKIQIWSLV